MFSRCSQDDDDDLIRKIRSVSKFMTGQPGKQTTAIHILPSISRSEWDNESDNEIWCS